MKAHRAQRSLGVALTARTGLRLEGIYGASLLLAALTVPAVATAQSSAATTTSSGPTFVVSPAFQSWSFAKDVPLDTLLVTGATQISVPIAIQIPLQTRWTASFTGAVASSKLDAHSAAGTVTRSFSGITDIRARLTGNLVGDALQLTVGVNIPTGAVNLSPEQNDVIRVTAAPALDAQVPIAGTGFGGTVGLVYARYIGAWAWAFGASAEKRGTYAPLDAQIAGLESRTELRPGMATHFSIGADGLVGQNRFSMGVLTDLYGSDELELTANGATPITQEYHLGPTVSAGAALDVKNSLLRDLTLRLNERYRTSFKDGAGNTVDGSSGNYFEFGASGYLGSPNRPSVLLGANVRQHTGLSVDKGFIGAGLTSVGGTLGVAIPAGSITWQPTVQFSVGTLKTQLVSTGITGISAGLTVSRR